MRFAPVFLALSLTLALGLHGCGIRGPLYLPPPAAKQEQPKQTPAPAAPKDEQAPTGQEQK
jgi:predicted small lipoprotein YifL